MDAPTQHEVGPGGRPGPQGGGVTVQEIRPVASLGHGHWLVHHYHAQLLRAGCGQQLGDTIDLCRGHLPVLVTPCARGVDANDQQIRRRMNGREIGPEHLGVARVRAGQPRPKVEQGNVVVAGDSQNWCPQSVDEELGRAETGPAAHAA
jgi:hypothetical protein